MKLYLIRHAESYGNIKHHGFGLQMVEELSVKYNGMFKIKEENGKFVAMLALSKVQKTEK